MRKGEIFFFSMPVSQLISTARRSNFLKRAGNVREKTICVDPFVDEPPALVSDITKYLEATSSLFSFLFIYSPLYCRIQRRKLTKSIERG